LKKIIDIKLRNIKELVNKIKKTKNYEVNVYLRKTIKPLLKILDNRVTDTLVSKILLGTLGIVPAYDDYFKAGIKKCRANIVKGILGKRQKDVFFENLANFYLKHRDDVLSIKNELDKTNKDGIKYPVMKLIDMHFWTIGMSKRQNRKA